LEIEEIEELSKIEGCFCCLDGWGRKLFEKGMESSGKR
jgi:hypothetical protein